MENERKKLNQKQKKMKKEMKVGILVILVVLLAFSVGGRSTGDKLKGSKDSNFQFNNLNIDVSICDYTEGKCKDHKDKDNLSIDLVKINDVSYNFSWTVDLPSTDYVSGLKVEYSSELDGVTKRSKYRKSGSKTYDFSDGDVVTFDYEGLIDQGYDVEIEEDEDLILLKISRDWVGEGYSEGDNVLFHPYVAGSNMVSYNWTFRVDNTGPNISLVSPSNGNPLSANTLTYNVSDLTVVSNCTLTLDGKTQEIDTSITESTDQTFIVGVGSGTHTWLINCTDYLNNKANSSTWSFTVPKKKEEEESGGGVGGDTCSSLTLDEGYKEFIFREISPFESVQLFTSSDKLAITSLELSVLTNVEDVRIKINEFASADELKKRIDLLKNLKNFKEEYLKNITNMIYNESNKLTGFSIREKPSYVIYKYTVIDEDNILEEQLDKVKIEFKVVRDWLIKQGSTKDDVYLMYFNNGEWKKVYTNWTSFDLVYNYYHAELDGFYLLAIAADVDRKDYLKEFIEKIGDVVKGEEVLEGEVEEVKESFSAYSVGMITLGVIGVMVFGVLVLVVILVKRIFKKKRSKK